MATLGELRAAIFPSAIPLAAVTPAGLERDVGWVRVLRARVPAFDALEAGDVAIVPARSLEVVAPSPAEVEALVDALARASCAAVLLLRADLADASPLVEACTTVGLPTFGLAQTEPTQLERSTIGYLLNRRAELEHQAGLLEDRLQELALHAAGPDALIATIAGFLGRAVALESSRGEVLAIHSPPDAAGGQAAATAFLAGSRAGALRIPLPGSGDGPTGAGAGGGAGRLVLLGDRVATELERVTLDRIGRLLALELTRDEAVRRAADAGRRESLPADGPPWVVLMARQTGPGGTTSAERAALRSGVARLAPARRLMLRGDAESLELRAVVAFGERDPGGVGVAGRVGALLGRTVAVSQPFADPLGRPAAEAEARATLEVSETLPERPAVARADRLPAYRLLAAMHSTPDGARHAHALLAPLLTGSPAARRERLATLAAVLEHPGLAEAATALGVHRNTLAYRLRRIEALTSWRLGEPELRLPLAIAVRLVQFEQD